MSAHSKSQKDFEVEIEAVSRKVWHQNQKSHRNCRSFGKKIQLAFWELLIEHWGIEPEEKLQQFCAKTALS